MIDIYADGADLDSIIALNENPLIKGFTTNPTLMKKSGISDYAGFAKLVLKHVTKKPVSFEVFSDEWREMYKQAHIISSWADNVFVKIPITNTNGYRMTDLMWKLHGDGVKINATAIFTVSQIYDVMGKLTTKDVPVIISIFAGRIADTCRNPESLFESATFNKKENQKLLWASTREVYNIMQAARCGADIITVPHDILRKYEQSHGKSLEEFSLDTVKMFYNDARETGFNINE